MMKSTPVFVDRVEEDEMITQVRLVMNFEEQVREAQNRLLKERTALVQTIAREGHWDLLTPDMVRLRRIARM
jgi:hypothetical protein